MNSEFTIILKSQERIIPLTKQVYKELAESFARTSSIHFFTEPFVSHMGESEFHDINFEGGKHSWNV